MVETILAIMAKFNELAASNPMLATLLGAGGATAIVVWMKNIPLMLYRGIVRQITTTISINNTYATETNYIAFIDWYAKNKWRTWSRSFIVEGIRYGSSRYYGGDEVNDTARDGKLGAGFGVHVFFYKRRLFWFRTFALDSSGADFEKYMITINGLTRDQKIIHDLFEEFRCKPVSGQLSVYSWDSNSRQWMAPVSIRRRDMASVIMNREQKESIITDIDRFYKSEDWYNSRGLPYKRSILLHGPAGTGKTSTAKALACHFDKSIYLVNLSIVDDETLIKAMSMIPKGCIILLEDVDCVSATKERVAESETDKEKKKLTLSGLLNALDGIVPLHGNLVVMTTNHIEHLDPALIRNGRVDRRECIDLLGDQEINDFAKLMFPSWDGTVSGHARIAGCDIMELYMGNRENLPAFLASIPKI